MVAVLEFGVPDWALCCSIVLGPGVLPRRRGMEIMILFKK